jgi:hypothetical protein
MKLKSKANGSLGLNAVGKAYSANYDPNYRMNYRPSYGHLRSPYPSSMKFVGDTPRVSDERARIRLPRPAPLLRDDDQQRQKRQERAIADALKRFLSSVAYLERHLRMDIAEILGGRADMQ